MTDTKHFIDTMILPQVGKMISEMDAIPALAFIVETGDNFGIVELDMANEFTKLLSLSAVSQFVGERSEAEAVITVAESWMVSIKAENGKEPDLNTRPSEHPDRTEVLMIMFEEKKGNRGAMLAPIFNIGEGKTKSRMLGIPMDIPGEAQGIVASFRFFGGPNGK